MNRELIDRQVEAAKENLSEVEQKMADPAVVSDQNAMTELGREHRRLTTIIQSADELNRLEKELESSREMVDDEDEEMAELAREEVAELEPKAEKAEATLRLALLPADEQDSRAAIVEIRAGTGGDEAGIFAGDLYRMYQRYIERNSWKSEELGSSASEMGGFKEVAFSVKGQDAFGLLKFESGVHRVQRVPVTESQGRVHTSAATVAVLPEAEEVDVQIDQKDLRIDVYRSTGHGGQSVNTTDSAVRITHLPTGVVVTCQDEKSQLKNKIKAMKVLRARLYQKAIEEEQAKRSASRQSMVGTGDRSAKIRTYNFPQNRVTDHRINLTLYRLDEIMDGDLVEVLDALRLADAEEKLREGV